MPMWVFVNLVHKCKSVLVCVREKVPCLLSDPCCNARRSSVVVLKNLDALVLICYNLSIKIINHCKNILGVVLHLYFLHLYTTHIMIGLAWSTEEISSMHDYFSSFSLHFLIFTHGVGQAMSLPLSTIVNSLFDIFLMAFSTYHCRVIHEQINK